MQRRNREIALLYFAHRNMARIADGPLLQLGRGRAHHRALFFVGRRPGMTVKDLHTILEISYQALHRILSDLISDDLMMQVPGESDRRKRRLFLTDRGHALEQDCAALQSALLEEAFARAGPGAGFADLLAAMMTERDRELAETLDFDDATRAQSPKTGSRLSKKAAKPSR